MDFGFSTRRVVRSLWSHVCFGILLCTCWVLCVKIVVEIPASLPSSLALHARFSLDTFTSSSTSLQKVPPIVAFQETLASTFHRTDGTPRYSIMNLMPCNTRHNNNLASTIANELFVKLSIQGHGVLYAIFWWKCYFHATCTRDSMVPELEVEDKWHENCGEGRESLVH